MTRPVISHRRRRPAGACRDRRGPAQALREGLPDRPRHLGSRSARRAAHAEGGGRAGGAAPVGSAHAGPRRRRVPRAGQGAVSRPPSGRCSPPTPTPTPQSPPSTESQVDYYLQKPWDPPEQQLYPVVDDLLDDWRAQYRPGYGGVESDRQPLHADGRTRSRTSSRAITCRTSSSTSRPPTSVAPRRARWPRASTLPLVILPGGERLAGAVAGRPRAEGRV